MIEKDNFLHRFAENVERLEGRWLVAVSGGGDSVALFRGLLALEGWHERIVVGHFNHCWGDFGEQSEAFVRDLAKCFDVDVRVGIGSGKAPNNAEAKARTERYAWMRQVCEELDLAGVLVAHTRSDVMENVLMRLGKGSGLHGLARAGLLENALGNMCIYRPLLGYGREELRAFLGDLGQDWLEDPDNMAGGSQRARVRALLPALAEAGIDEVAVAGSVASLLAAERALDAQVQEWLSLHVVEHKHVYTIDKEQFLKLDEEVAVRVLADALQGVGADGMVVRRGKRVALLARIREQAVGVSTLGNVRFEWDMQAVRGERLR